MLIQLEVVAQVEDQEVVPVVVLVVLGVQGVVHAPRQEGHRDIELHRKPYCISCKTRHLRNQLIS